jgi:hypothetical protein
MNTNITPSGRPNKSWTLETLEDYALDRASEINNFGRKTIVQTWLFGESLALIRGKQKEKGEWMTWVKTQPYSLSTATNSIKVYERVNFDDLNQFNDRTVSDMKSALEIIKSPPPERRRRATPDPITPDILTDHTTDVAPPEANDETTGVAPEKATIRKMTTTDYSRNGVQKNSTPEVGVSLTASEVLGKAYTLLIEAEKVGMTPDCNEVLAQISAKVADLTQTLTVDVSA